MFVLRLFVLFLLFVFFQTFLKAVAIQTHIPNGVWTLIGINSIYEDLSTISPWLDDTSFVITDVADSKFTHIQTTNSSYGYATSSGLSTTMNPSNNITIFDNAIMSLFAIINTRTLNNRTLNGSTSNAVHIKLTEAKTKKDIVMYTMYIEGLSSPTVRIVYQSDYEGDIFKVKFGRNDLQNITTFYAYFSNQNTYDNPAKLYFDLSKSRIAKKSVLIADAIDFNITDNNITSMQDDVFDITNDIKNIVTGDSLLVYRFNKGFWQIFNSQNTNTKSNGFDNFNIGEGYWVRVESRNAHNDGNFTKIGLISSSIGSITQEVYENMDTGWNIATFSDDYRYKRNSRFGPKYSLNLRYSPTSMFIPTDILETEGINLFFRPHSSDISVFEQNITLDISTTGRYQSTSDIAQGIHIAAMARNKMFDENIRIRAYPAMNRNGDEGLIIISDQSFEINSSSSSITTLSNQRLTQSGTNGYFAPYGDYLLASNLVDTSSSDVNTSMEVNFHLLSDTPIELTDLNISDNIVKINRIYDGLDKASRDERGVRKINNDIFLLDLDFDSSFLYDDASDFSSMIIGSSEKINIKDTTYTKIFRYNISGNFKIKGLLSQDISLPRENNITRLINTINNYSSITGIIANRLNTASGTFFMISSNRAGSLRELNLVEDGINLFDYFLSLSSALLPNQGSVLGSLGNVYTHDNLLNSTLNVDTATLYGLNTHIASYSNILLLDVNETGNPNGNGSIDSIPFHKNALNYSRVYAPSFPSGGTYSFTQIFSHVKKKAVSMIGQAFGSNGTSYWEVIDLTKAPQDWLGTRDYKNITSGNDFDIQTLLHIKENKAYWVQVVDSSSRRDVSLDSIYNDKVNIDKSFINYFNNEADSAGEIQIENHIFHKVSLSFNDKNVGKYVAREYNINAQLEYGDVYDFDALNDDFEFTISNAYMELNDANIIELKSVNELGESFISPNNKVSIDFKQPDSPNLSWVEGALVIGNIFHNYGAEVYYDYISEYQVNRHKNLLEYPKLENNNRLKWKYGESKSEYGRVKKIIITLNNDGLYSNGKVCLYAPLNTGYALSLDDSSPAHSTNRVYSLENQAYIDKVDVQLSRLDDAKEYQENVQVIYYPENIDSSFTQSSVPSILYIKSSDSHKLIASISYNRANVGNVFYFKHKQHIYQGIFPSDSSKLYVLDKNNVLNIYNMDTQQPSENYLLRLDYSPGISNSQNIHIKPIETF